MFCGDISINYLNESKLENQLDNLLLSYNLTSIIDFPIRVQNTSATAIDNFFIDISQYESFMAIPIINGISDHDAQLLIITTGHPHVPIHNFKMTRNINKYTVSDFIANLSYESWDSIFNSKDVNTMYNSFLNIYLRIFYSSFPLKKVTTRNKHDINWITLGIKTSCWHKRELYLLLSIGFD
jgi:hypothetical protein